MNWVDYIVLGVIVLSVLFSLQRGLISEVMALAIWVVAFWVAWLLGPAVGERFRGIIELPSARMLVGYGSCFLLVLLLGALLRLLISRLVKSTGLSGTDRMLGMGFGLVRGILLVTLVAFLFSFTPFTRDPWWQQSVLLQQAEVASNWLLQRLPENIRRYAHPSTAPSLPLNFGRLPQTVNGHHLSGRTASSTWPAGSSSMMPRVLPAAASTSNPDPDTP